MKWKLNLKMNNYIFILINVSDGWIKSKLIENVFWDMEAYLDFRFKKVKIFKTCWDGPPRL